MKADSVETSLNVRKLKNGTKDLCIRIDSYRQNSAEYNIMEIYLMTYRKPEITVEIGNYQKFGINLEDRVSVGRKFLNCR